METLVANFRFADISGAARSLAHKQMEEWFTMMDRILDVHRCNFVYREFTSEELRQHKIALALAIRFSNFINALTADPDSGDRQLQTRLQIRIRQLQDAYDTFHDETLSDEQSEKILKQVFPE